MANWNKLNSELDNLLDNLSDEEWDNWMAKRAAQKSLRKKELMMMAKIQEETQLLGKITGVSVFSQSVSAGIGVGVLISHINQVHGNLLAGEENYAFAA